MALLNPIELVSGADRCLQLALWGIWVAALLSLIGHSQRMPGLMLMISAVALLWAIPKKSASLKDQRLLMHANGSAIWGEGQCSWNRNIWRSRWYTVIQIRSGHTKRSVWISASNNSTDDYRRLGVWCRFSPQNPNVIANDSQ